MNDTAATINQEMIDALLVIHRIASGALSAEKRVGQRIQRDPRGEINGLLVQMMAIEKLARAGFSRCQRRVNRNRRRGAEDSLSSFRGLCEGPSLKV
jgi:hypothetical protein